MSPRRNHPRSDYKPRHAKPAGRLHIIGSSRSESSEDADCFCCKEGPASFEAAKAGHPTVERGNCVHCSDSPVAHGIKADDGS